MPPQPPPPPVPQQEQQQQPLGSAKCAATWTSFNPQKEKKFFSPLSVMPVRLDPSWHPEQWPQSIAILPIGDRTDLTVEAIEQWVNQHKGLILAVRAEEINPGDVVPIKVVEGLTRVLAARKWYAWIAWPATTVQTGQSDIEKRGLLYSKGDTLWAGFFPQGAMPELPQRAPEGGQDEIAGFPQDLVAFLRRVPPHYLQQLQQMEAGRRVETARKLVARYHQVKHARLQQLQQQHLQQQKQQQQQQL